MTPTRSHGPAEPPKKRRTFFSSSLSMLPKLPTPSTLRPAITPRSKVLAALSDPEERALNAGRPVRERKQRVLEGRATEEQVTEASGSRPKSARPRSPPVPKVEDETPPTARPKRSRASITKITTPTKSPLRRSTLSSPSAASRPPTRVDPPKTGKGSKAVNAQHSNAALSALMEKSMRATIGGRERPYMRVPVWEEPSRSRKKVSSTTIIIRRPGAAKRTAALAAKQKTKRKLTEEDELEEDEEPTVATPAKKKGKEKASGSGKEYLTAGFYCQDANAKSPFKLVNKVLNQGSTVAGLKPGKRKLRDPLESLLPKLKKSGGLDRLTFPPLPYDHGYQHFFGKEHEFVLPYDIHQEAQSGAFNDKKKPAPYQKIRSNVFPERTRVTADRAVCKCEPESGCGDNCINRIMSYLCGKDCPCGDRCTNRSLAKRPMAQTKVGYTGSRGFGLFAMEDIKEGDFVIDYRGEVISLNIFYQRIRNEYAGQKNFYALAYDLDEVIDSGMRGNDARFINHGCNPNLEVRKYQTLGDGMEEYEIGMWAIKDIKQGEELFYDYNFDCFGGAKDDLRTQCRCGAPNCVGFLGRKPGEKSAKEIAIEIEAKKAADAIRLAHRSRGKKVVKKVGKKKPIKFSGAVERAKKVLARKPVIQRKVAKPAPILETPAAIKNSAHEDLAPSSGFDQQVDMAFTTGLPPADEPPTASTSNTLTTAVSTAPPLTPSRSFDMDGDAASDGSQSASSKQRKSGWANWLRKIAAEKTRTLEEWHEERMKRRRGIAWMNMMIAEFGVAPSPAPPTPEAYADGRKPAGSSASFANTLAAQGLGPGPAGIRNLGGPKNVYRSDNWNKAREEQLSRTPGPADRDQALVSDDGDLFGPRRRSGSGKMERQSVTPVPVQRPSSHAEVPCPTDQTIVTPEPSGPEGSTSLSRRESQKRKAIAARNGAPMGWAFVDPTAVPTQGQLDRIEVGLPRSARRARQSVARDEIMRMETEPL